MSNSELQSNFDVNIFIIDDEPLIAEVIKMYLSQVGYKNLHIFNNPVEAIETLSKIKVDLILTDVNMPELGGKFLTKLIRRESHLRTTPVIAITSDETIETRDHLLANGVVEILAKPVQQIELVRSVNRAIEHQLRLSNDTRIVEQQERAKVQQLTIEKEKSVRAVFNR